jgi:hypothetical protein
MGRERSVVSTFGKSAKWASTARQQVRRQAVPSFIETRYSPRGMKRRSQQ